MHTPRLDAALLALVVAAGLTLALPTRAVASGRVVRIAPPTTEDFKRALEAQLLNLKPVGTQTRTVLFGEVRAGTPNGPFFPFQVTATIHDYGTGYPPNHYYGETCVGTMDRWKFDMRKDEFGGWIVQGRMTVSDAVCKKNPAEGVSAIPLAGLSGTRVGAATAAEPARRAVPARDADKLYIGEYACYGTGNRIMAGMGFRLKAGGAYADVDGGRGGTYAFNAAASTLAFRGGFLAGQTGKNVQSSGFTLSTTVNCEPWR